MRPAGPVKMISGIAVDLGPRMPQPAATGFVVCPAELSETRRVD
jgi:hypothetical protein